MNTARYFFVLFITAFIVLFGTSVSAKEKQKAVLVTGASSGIGLNITNHLVKKGYYVYAGARKQKDLKRLNAMDNVSSVKLDVTKQDQIDAAVKFVQSQGRGLFAVVNNAGVGTFTPMSTFPDDEIIWIHDVNVMGPHRINKAFLPLLKESKGRTTTIGSISGYISGASSGPYSMSKFAVEAYTEALAMDLKDSGVKVSVIEPGSYRSKIREKVTMHLMTGKYETGKELSEEQKKRLEQANQRNAQLKAPDEVSQAVLKFLAADKPKLRYMVVPDKQQAEVTIKTTLGRVVQLNADQPYEYTRDELVKMLDELLEQQKN